jgi:hypothetical protein
MLHKCGTEGWEAGKMLHNVMVLNDFFLVSNEDEIDGIYGTLLLLLLLLFLPHAADAISTTFDSLEIRDIG